ncbi:hypothetical protein [Halomonas sp. I5-271120]|uniref:hypothetical protein n=1 Tax=Halomonas sp. I5-271120 TaxID=3061632 RepID=UPI0027153EBA|nr:hypothetical protein [Halomonas sp. I5-271120]
MSELTAPFFRPADAETIQWWLSHGVRKPLGHKVSALLTIEREVLKAWGVLSQQGEVFGVDQLIQEMNSRSATPRTDRGIYTKISRMSLWLAHSGVVWRERASEMGVGHSRSMIFSLRAPTEVARNWKGSPRATQDNPEVWRKSAKANGSPTPPAVEPHVDKIEATHRLLRQLEGQALTTTNADDNEHWTLNLVSQLLERCSRASTRDRSESLASRIQLGSEHVDVTTISSHQRSSDGSYYGMITGDDAQLILAILTTAVQDITRARASGQRPRNWLRIDLQDLFRLLIPNGTRKEYKAMQAGMARIINTEFILEFDQDGSLKARMEEAQGGQSVDRFRFRLVEHVVEGLDDEPLALDEWEPSDAGMRYFAFSLHPLLFQGLQNGQGLLVHPELLYERSGLVHKLYHHLRLHSGPSAPYIVHAEDLLTSLNLATGANYRRARIDFSENLWDLLRERSVRAGALLPSELTEPTPVRLFDLDLIVAPTDHHKSALVIEAYHSDETKQLIERQEARRRRLQQQALQDGSGEQGFLPFLNYDK